MDRSNSIFLVAEEFMAASNWAQLDNVIASVVVSKCETANLLALLQATYPGKAKLAHRATLLEQTRKVLLQRGEKADMLLAHL